jgi:hypothetical protein
MMAWNPTADELADEAAKHAPSAIRDRSERSRPLTNGDPPSFRTLADISDEPPGPLLFGMWEPDGPNLAYAAPGTGKGSTGAWTCVEAQKVGMRPMIYDPEQREREWARRVSGLGGDRSNVVYLEPRELPPPLAGRPIWDVAEHIGRVAASAGADLLIVDSIVPATGIGEERLRSDAQVPYLYVAALDGLRLPSLSFGHPPKGQPEGEPFGSFAWVGAMRFTWLGTRAETDMHRVRWRPRKRNERGHVPGVLLTFDYASDGRLAAVTREDDEESTREWLLAALTTGSRAVADLADELAEEAEEHITEDALRRIKERLSKTLRRMDREGLVAKEGTTGSKVKWGLKWQA